MFLIIQLSFKFEERKIQHKNSALKYLRLRDKYRGLITDIMNESITTDQIITQRNTLQSEYQMICEFASQTGSKEYAEAQKRLNAKGVVVGEDFTWSDGEINRFLPDTLKIS